MKKVLSSQLNWHFDSFLMVLAACWDSDICPSISSKCQHAVTNSATACCFRKCCLPPLFILFSSWTVQHLLRLFFSDDSVHPTPSSYRQLALCIGLWREKRALPCYSFRGQASGNQCSLSSMKEKDRQKKRTNYNKAFGKHKMLWGGGVVQNASLIRWLNLVRCTELY